MDLNEDAFKNSNESAKKLQELAKNFENSIAFQDMQALAKSFQEMRENIVQSCRPMVECFQELQKMQDRLSENFEPILQSIKIPESVKILGSIKIPDIEALSIKPLFDIKDFGIKDINIKNPVYEVAAQNHASEFYKIIKTRIKEFESALDNEHEVGIQLVAFSQVMTISVTDVGYCNPSTIIFRGLTEDGQPLELIQHVTQLSYLLMGLKRSNPEEPKRVIGFINPTESQEP